jgi:hypothetical protein
MNLKRISAIIASVGAAATAIAGSAAFADNKWVNGIALALIAVSQLVVHSTANDTNESLHNGTFQRLIKAAILELAKEKDMPFEIHSDQSSIAAQTQQEGGEPK